MLESSHCLLLLLLLPPRPLLHPKYQWQLSQCTPTQPIRFMQMRKRFRKVDHHLLLPRVLLYHPQRPGMGKRNGILGIEKCLEWMGWGIKTTLMGVRSKENQPQPKGGPFTRHQTVRLAAPRRMRFWQQLEQRLKMTTQEIGRSSSTSKYLAPISDVSSILT